MSCLLTTHCIFGTGNSYDGEYTSGATFNGYSYFTGDTTPTYFIYFSTGATENFWCLSSSLGGTCEQVGTLNSFSLCPDFWGGFYSVGACPATTTTTTSPCDVFDFDAIFDCIIPTTTTTTAAPTTTTTTTLPPDPCSGVSMYVTMTAYTTTTTTIPVTTTTTTIIDRPCKFDGMANFNIFDEYMRCGNSKNFRDCFSGIDYYTPDVLQYSGGPLTQGNVYKLVVNGVETCGTFVGLVDNISGIDEIEIIYEIGPEVEGSCIDCLPPTTTTTTTIPPPTTTTTTTEPPCVLKEYIIQATGFMCSYKYFDCDGNEIVKTLPKVPVGDHIIVCSSQVPVAISNCATFSANEIGPC